MVEASKFLHNL